MRSGRWILCVIVVLGLASPCSAFNGMRKGFVLGGGLGIAPLVYWRTEGGLFANFDQTDVEETRVGGSSNLLIGYGWDERNLLVFEANGTSITSDKLTDATLFQGFSGPVWYHYFNPAAPGFFTSVGIGFYSFYYDIKDGKEDSNDSGLGLMGGVGYEFARHWQVSVVINGGRTSNRDVDFRHFNIETLISTIAF